MKLETLPLMALSIALLLGGSVVDAKTKPDDDQIAKILIQESINGYSGSCPCPYNTDRAGRSCGKRSAYSRAGGASVLCFRRDVTAEMIEAYRRDHP